MVGFNIVKLIIIGYVGYIGFELKKENLKVILKKD